MLVCISIGIAATIGFHLLVKERGNVEEVDEKKDIKLEEMTLSMELDTSKEVQYPRFNIDFQYIVYVMFQWGDHVINQVKSIMWWLRLPSLYLVALV